MIPGLRSSLARKLAPQPTPEGLLTRAFRTFAARRERRALASRILGLAVLALVLMACDADYPAYQLDLVQTSWLISKVDGADIPPGDRAKVTFGIDEVQVDLGCGSITGTLIIETDSDGLGMLGDVDPAGVCGGQATALERTQLEALDDVRSWRVETNDRIVMKGGAEVTLERVPEP
jgi:hypothetical protein